MCQHAEGGQQGASFASVDGVLDACHWPGSQGQARGGPRENPLVKRFMFSSCHAGRGLYEKAAVRWTN